MKFRIINASFENFIGFEKISKNNKFSVDFTEEKESNFFLIYGENGFGKTTLLESLTPYTQMVSRNIKESIKYPARKTVTFFDQQKNIIKTDLIFEENNTKGYIYVNDILTDETAKGNVTEYNYQIEKLFGSFEKFKNSLFIKQGILDIVAAKPSERVKIINSFLGNIEIYDDIKKYCVSKEQEHKLVSEEINEQLKKMETYKNRYDTLKKFEDDFNVENFDSLKEETKQLNIKLSDLKVKKGIFDNLQKTLLEKEQELTQLPKEEENIIKLKSILEELNQLRKSLNIESLNKHFELKYKIEDNLKKIERNKNKLDLISSTSFKFISETQSEIEEKINILKSNKIYEEKIEKLSSEIKEILNSQELKFSINELEELVDILNKINSLKENGKKLELKNYSKDITKLKVDIEDFEKNKSKLIELKDRLEEYSNNIGKEICISCGHNLDKDDFELKFKELNEEILKIETKIKDFNLNSKKDILYSMEVKTSKYHDSVNELHELKSNKLYSEEYTIDFLKQEIVFNKDKNEKIKLLEEFKSKIKSIDIDDISTLKGTLVLIDFLEQGLEVEEIDGSYLFTIKKEELEKELLKSNKEISKQKELSEKVSIIEKNLKEQEQLEIKLKNLNKDIEDTRTKIKENNFCSENLEEINILFENKNKIYEEKTKELEQYEQDKKFIMEMLKEFEEIQNRNIKNKEEIFTYNKLKNYSNRIKNAYISNFFSNITETVNALIKSDQGSLGNLNITIEQKTTKSFNILAHNGLNEVSDISLLSGAEQAVVARGISLALAAKYNFGILWLDESDGALSTGNKDSFIKTLDKAKNLIGVEQIFLVSHNPNLKKEVDKVVYLPELD